MKVNPSNIVLAVMGVLLLFFVAASALLRWASDTSEQVRRDYARAPIPTPVPVPTPTPKPLSKEEKAERARLDSAQRKSLREALPDDYLLFIVALYPNHNGIKIALRGNSLWAEHAFFSRNEFKYGPSGPEVLRWVGSNDVNLRNAGITRVGVRDPESGDCAWFNVQ